jgi:hypothetical protein
MKNLESPGERRKSTILTGNKNKDNPHNKFGGKIFIVNGGASPTLPKQRD